MCIKKSDTHTYIFIIIICVFDCDSSPVISIHIYSSFKDKKIRMSECIYMYSSIKELSKLSIRHMPQEIFSNSQKNGKEKQNIVPFMSCLII